MPTNNVYSVLLFVCWVLSIFWTCHVIVFEWTPPIAWLLLSRVSQLMWTLVLGGGVKKERKLHFKNIAIVWCSPCKYLPRLSYYVFLRNVISHMDPFSTWKCHLFMFVLTYFFPIVYDTGISGLVHNILVKSGARHCYTNHITYQICQFATSQTGSSYHSTSHPAYKSPVSWYIIPVSYQLTDWYQLAGFKLATTFCNVWANVMKYSGNVTEQVETFIYF